MGLDIGDDVFVSFISNGQEANVYRELLIASASLQELDSAPKSITIPDELMENAGIMPDADIQIICGQGVILITAQASMSTSELREVLQSLYLQLCGRVAAESERIADHRHRYPSGICPYGFIERRQELSYADVSPIRRLAYR